MPDQRIIERVIGIARGIREVADRLCAAMLSDSTLDVHTRLKILWAFMDQYEKQYKHHALMLRAEIESRLASKGPPRSELTELSYKHPGSHMDLRNIPSDLERLIKFL
jgi:hypothetical protein